MKFLKLYNIFNEARQNPEEIIQKYYNNIDVNILNKLIKADPTSIIVDDKIKKIGNYVKFLVKIWRNKGLLLEDLPRAKNYLQLFIENKSKLPNVDILKFDKLSDLGKVVRPYLNLESGELTHLIKELEENSYKFLYEDEKWRIYQPLTEKAAATLGYGTEWCTAWGKFSLNKNYRSRTSRFNNYKDNLLVFVDQETDKPVWQLHLSTKQFNNVNDYNIFKNFDDFLYKNEELCPVIFPQLKDLNKNENLIGIIKWNYLLPNIYHDKVNEQLSNRIPLKIINSLELIENADNKHEDRVHALLYLFGLDKDKYDTSIHFGSGYAWKDIEFTPKLYKSQIHHYYDLEGFLNWISKSASNFVDYYDSNDIYIENILSEEEVFGSALQKDLNKIGLEWIKSFEQVEEYLNDAKQYKKISDTFNREYNSEYVEQINDYSKELASKIKEVIKMGDYQSENISINLEEFLFTIKTSCIEKNSFEPDFKLNFEDTIESVFSNNNLPDNYESFADEVYKNFNFDDSKIIEKMQREIYDILWDRKDDLDNLENEQNKTEEERQKEIEKLENTKKETIEKFKKILPKLGFSNWIFDNNSYKITFFPENFSEDGESLYVEVFNKIENKEIKSYTNPENFESQFKKHVIKIEELKEKKRIKDFNSFNPF